MYTELHFYYILTKKRTVLIAYFMTTIIYLLSFFHYVFELVYVSASTDFKSLNKVVKK